MQLPSAQSRRGGGQQGEGELTWPPARSSQCSAASRTSSPSRQRKPAPILGNIAWTKPMCDKFHQLTSEVELEAHIVSEISPEIFSVHLQDVARGEDVRKKLKSA